MTISVRSVAKALGITFVFWLIWAVLEGVTPAPHDIAFPMALIALALAFDKESSND